MISLPIEDSSFYRLQFGSPASQPRSKFGRYCADCKRAVSGTCLVAFVKVFPFVPPYLPIWHSSQHKTFPSTSIIHIV